MSASHNAIEFDRIGRVFASTESGRKTIAIDDFSLSVRAGEFVCVVGPSGCGKSTLLDLAGGFDKPTSGVVRVLGKPVKGPGSDRGMVFQEASLFPWLDVLGNICFGPRTRGVPAAQYLPLAHRLIQEMGLRGFEHHATYQLSGGMRQRVAIARAWISLPQILLMDEPFGALDAQTRLQMQESLLDVWEKNKSTVLFITHDIEEAILLADRVCIMSARPGKVRDIIDLPFERPRLYEDLLADPRFGLIKRDITRQIREESRLMSSHQQA